MVLVQTKEEKDGLRRQQVDNVPYSEAVAFAQSKKICNQNQWLASF